MNKPREEEVLRALQQIAASSPETEALLLSGSRAGEGAAADDYSDYDVIFAVRRAGLYEELAAQVRKTFAPLVIEQRPDPPGGFRYGYLMQFAAVRIDLSFVAADRLAEWTASERAVRVLWERPPFRCGRLPLAEPRCFGQTEFAACCNEFWWTLPYVAKGVARRQLLYANWHLEHCLRAQLLLILDQLYPRHAKCFSDLGQWVGAETSAAYESTFACETPDGVWRAARVLAALFSRHARALALSRGLCCDEGEEERVRKFLPAAFGLDL